MSQINGGGYLVRDVNLTAEKVKYRQLDFVAHRHDQLHQFEILWISGHIPILLVFKRLVHRGQKCCWHRWRFVRLLAYSGKVKRNFSHSWRVFFFLLLQAILLQAQVDAAMETAVNQAVMWMRFLFFVFFYPWCLRLLGVERNISSPVFFFFNYWFKCKRCTGPTTE